MGLKRGGFPNREGGQEGQEVRGGEEGEEGKIGYERRQQESKQVSI